MGADQEKGDELGYEEFDSSEFEPEELDKDAEKSGADDDASDKGADGKKLTAEEAFGDDDGTGASEKEGEEALAKKASGEGDGKPAYEANHTYKVYDEEKTFPEQLKTIVKDKETEDFVRDLLTKADGLDGMKPRHQEAVQQRDDYRSQVDFYKADINRVLTLRDKQPHLFAAEVGISDDWIIQRAKEIVNAKETPEQWNDFNRRRADNYDVYTRSQEVERQQVQATQSFANTIQQQMTAALQHPDVSSFQSEFDKIHGLGSFQEEVRKHGYYHYERTKMQGKAENLAPMDAVKAVYDFHKKTFARAEPQGGAKAADNVRKEAGTKRVQEKPIPNVGKGRNASPTGKRFKTIKEMREYVDKHVPSA